MTKQEHEQENKTEPLGKFQGQGGLRGDKSLTEIAAH